MMARPSQNGYGYRTTRQKCAHAAHSKRRFSASTLLVPLLVIVLLAVAALGAYYVWFTTSLNNVLDKNEDATATSVLSQSVAGEPFYMLVLASDERLHQHETASRTRTDVMILMRVDAKNRQFTLLSIPRDTPYTLDDGTTVKINELCNIGGPGMAVNGVSDVTHVPISHYALVYMSDCKNVVDELGGVEVNVQVEINNNDPETEENVNIQPGLQVLDGRGAQAFAISRHEVESNQDAFRQSKIRELIMAIVDKILDRPFYEIPGTVITVAEYIETDLNAEDLIGMFVDFALGSGEITFYQGSGPSDGALNEEVGLWMCYEDPEGWARVMAVIDSGGDPSAVT